MLRRLGSLTRYALSVWLATNAVGQVTTASFYGVVQDPSGARVASGEVTLINELTGAVRNQTLTDGEFAFQFLPVGQYRLQIRAPGFKELVVRTIELGAAQQVRQTYVLELGVVSEQLSVTAQAPLVNSVTAEQRQSLSVAEVGQLPVARRTLSDFFSLGAGITATGTGQFALNGLGQAATSFTADGVDASSNPQAPQALFKEGHNYIAVVSMEAVQEVQVSKGVLSAEFGRTLGGSINVITKGGTNTWHGSAFHVFNAEELNARLQFLTTTPNVVFNQYGGSLGGPMRRDRAFIFAALEGYQERSATVVQGNVPTPQLRSAMTAAFPEYKLLLDQFPLPNQPFAAAADTAAYIGPGSVRSSDLHAVVRPDLWLHGGRLMLSGSYVHSRPDREVPSLLPVNPRYFGGKTHRLTRMFHTDPD